MDSGRRKREREHQKNGNANINVPGVTLSITVSDRRPGGVNSVCPTSVSR